MEIQLKLQKNGREIAVPFHVDRMVNAGFTGRDQKEVRHHLDELSAKGIEVPTETPLIYPVIPDTLTTAEKIVVYGPETSGEIEYVLFIKDETEIYVGIGSDHTDRKLEETDIPRAKQMCPNVISPVVWDLEDVAGHWDDLVMSCRVEKDGSDLEYQKGSLDLLMSPAELMAFVAGKVTGPLSDMVIFSGTVKMETPEFVFADHFSGRLTDPVLKRELVFTYRIHPMDYLAE
ncbi:MAG: DUF2848 family protein [Desulfotignum sp.]|nr:DUF2848 family protein [Desulfotignum sp.]